MKELKVNGHLHVHPVFDLVESGEGIERETPEPSDTGPSEGRWNPVKELKVSPVPINIIAYVKSVESGEGIERPEASSTAHASTHFVESGEGIERRFIFSRVV